MWLSLSSFALRRADSAASCEVTFLAFGRRFGRQADVDPEIRRFIRDVARPRTEHASHREGRCPSGGSFSFGLVIELPWAA